MHYRPRFAVLARSLLLALPLLAALPSRAHAQSEPPHDYQRVFGLGSAFGGGIQAAGFVGIGGANARTGILPAADLPTLEFKYFFQPQDWSIDVTIPLTNIFIINSLAHIPYFGADAFFNFNVGTGSVRLVAGPGLGFEVASSGGNGSSSQTLGGIRVLGEVGFEALTSHRHFGFSLLARPFAEFVPAGGVAAVGGGALLLVDFMGYYTR